MFLVLFTYNVLVLYSMKDRNKYGPKKQNILKNLAKIHRNCTKQIFTIHIITMV